jgi:hypothetical protein
MLACGSSKWHSEGFILFLAKRLITSDTVVFDKFRIRNYEQAIVKTMKRRSTSFEKD